MVDQEPQLLWAAMDGHQMVHARTHVTALSPYNHYIVTYTPHSKFQVTLFIYLLSKLIFFNLKKIKFTENKLKYMTSNQFRQLFYEIFVGPVFI